MQKIKNFLQITLISCVIKTQKNSWAKIVDNPIKKFSKFQLLNPFVWLRFLFIHDAGCDKSVLDFKIPRLKYRGHIFFDINKALELNPNFKRIGLIFCIGIGDYFFSTQFIERLKQEFSFLKFDAYVCQNQDSANNPLVGKLLQINPYFENVYYFNGEPYDTKNYNYSQVYEIASKDTLVLPMIHEYNPYIKSRYHALCRTFMINDKLQNTPLPKIYTDYPASNNVLEILKNIETKFKQKKYSGIIIFNSVSRSANHTYPYSSELVQKLISLNYLILSFDDIDLSSTDFIKISSKKTDITESIKLLSMLTYYRLFFVGVNSVFDSISSALEIKKLTLQIFYDKGIKSVWFPNVYVLTPKDYPFLPKKNVLIANKNDYSVSNRGHYIYNVDFVIKQFSKIS